MSECRSCGAKIIWALSLSGKKIPMDAAPLAATPPKEMGVFALLRRTGEPDPLALPFVAVGLALEDAVRLKVPLFVSHFATCPNSDQHRKS